MLALLGGVLAFLAVDHVFNVRGNLTFLAFRDSTQPLELQLRSGEWKPAAEVSIVELHYALRDQAQMPGATWKTLRVRRRALDWKQQVTQSLFRSEVNVLEFEPEPFHFRTSYKDNFEVTTARERMKSDLAVFSITANFRDPDGKPLGLVVHEGKQANRPFPAWTGYFFVKKGRPWFGPKSLFEEMPGVLEEASQGYPSVMKNHTVFPYVDMAPNRYFDGKKLTYRALAGVKQDGRVMFVLSANGGLMNVAEVAALAQKLNVQHATLLDGGRALQYSLKISGLPHHFHAFNTWLKLDHRLLQRERSPVFITVKRRRETEGEALTPLAADQ